MLTDQDREYINNKFDEFNKCLELLGFEIDHHCEFVSVLVDKKTMENVAILHSNNEIEWVE